MEGVIGYKAAMEEIAGIVAGIEKGEIDIDLLEKKLQRADMLVTFCCERLRATEDGVAKVLAKMTEATKGDG